MAEALEEQAVDDDLRLVYIHSFLSKSVKFKVDKWHKMMGADEYNALILDFLNNSTHKILLFSLTNAGALIPAVSFPVVSKTKVTYFIRALEEAITPQNFHSVIICGDISARPLDALAVLFEQIYIPILSNGAIQKRWPTAVRDDMKKHIYDLKSAVFQVGGLLSGRTLLALPDDADRVYDVERNIINSGGEAVDLHFKTSIEGTVIKWASQINEVLKDHATSLSANASSVAEFQKWSNRLQNLESIYFQLNDPRIKAMTSILKLTNSAYLPCFKSLFKSVIAAVHEANEVNICMKVLVLQVNRFDEVEDFLEAEKLLPAIMHTLCLIWAHCKYFTSSSKLINILSLICNMLITKARKYINPSKIFQIELEETAPAIVKTIHVLNNFKKLFDFCRQNLYSYFPKGEKSVPWLFDKEAVFERFNIFIHRMQKLEALFSTAIEYSKLEKIELGGILGRYLSGKVSKMHTEFQLIIRQFQQVTYDPTDIDDESFVKDYANFTERVVDIDRRLASILNQAVMDCHNLQQFLKLIYVVGSLLERPIIHKEVSPKCERVIDMLSEELDACSDIFNEQMDSFLSTGQMQVDLNWPPIAGRLQWIIKLRSRLQTSISKYKEWDSQIVKLEESSDALKKYDIMMGKLDQLEDETISKWVAEISNTISQNLSKTLFAIHADTKLLSINYSCELIAAVREIRYLLLLETYSIPDLAIQFYSKNNEFILLIFTLDQIIQWYNLLRESSRPEEFNLIEHQIKEIDTIIDYSQEVLTWNSQDAHLTIEKIKTLVYRLYLRVSKAQRNIKEIIRLSSQWNSRPLYCRKNNKKDALLSLENRGEKLQKRYHEIRKASSEIYKLTKENFYLYFKGGTENVGENGDTIGNLESPSNKVVDEKKFSFDEDDLLSNKKKRNLESQNHHETNNSDSSSPESAQGFEWSEVDDDAESRQKWDNYIHYVDSIVLEGLIKAVNCSIGYLEEQMVCSSEKAPLMEISLELTEPLITFQPSLDLQDPEGLFCLVVNLIDEIQAMSEYAHQISTHKQGQSFREDIEGNDDISFFISSILSETENVINEAVKFANTFEQYNYLWLGDRFEYLNQFLKYGKPLTAEEEEMIGKSDEDGQIIIKESSPRLDDYKAQIDMYEEIYKEVDQIPSSKVFFNWFRVDIRPFKQALLNNICKWSMLFKRHLMDYVVYNLADLADFINKSDVNLNHGFLLQEGDYDGLVHVMGCLLKVKERQIMTDIMFTPFQEIIEFLKNYDLDFPEEIFVQLQDLPDQWINTKKLALSVKAAISPLVQREANTIKKRIILFDIRQMLYKELFKDYEFFNWTCKEPYAEIDNIHLEIKNLEEMTCRLSEQAVLFEVSCPEFKFVPVVRKELKLLKILWDYIIIIRSWFRDWEDTHWTKIDSEAMDMELKKFSKELRSLDKDMRNWEIYLQLEAMIKNMITALKAVAELQNPAIRERHWQQLMAATKVKFMIDESTTLADLLALHLYKYEEEVKTIVDKSVKEQSMEKILNELKQIWGMMEFTYEINERTNCWLLKCSEDTIEILEEHQVQLQNMMSSKFVEYFQQEVSEWQRKLGKVDQVVNLWLEVQRTWIHLESIFIGSEDIRRQLPHDSARFDATDQEFKTMLCDIHKIPNMVNACNRPNLVETLEKVQLELTKCEKALAQYLESKRCIYPRFYFISSADLLDILSNSDNPEAVCRHLTKLYDSIAKIKFREDSDPRKRKIAKGMFAKDGEYVEFSEDCDCNGQVEKWLNNVTDVMRKTGRHYFAEAVLTYDEKPREQWIFDYPAQSALCGTQIWWTTEVELAFARLEEGYENALKDYNKKQIIQLNTLISLLLGDLTTGDRQKIMTICTIDVHARDVICKLVNARVESSAAFQWQSQLRHRWDKVEWDCFANICDAEFRYDYEYLGNTPRLVTTPLTDRCYITLSQSLHLIMGGAPAGPAGTGKTETTKDLGKAIGIMVYVFNCSEQMDYKSVGNIYKGLAQTGAWGCFDEFNRISVEVLSVVAVQVKTVLDAIKGKKSIFNFLGETIRLVPTVGMFITMNPGYAGRAELPENLKALFRPCAMVVPDFELICEIMLVAEGFQEARMLARKFITLYSLCKELLSNQDHYDWGLRAIKSVLVVAGSLKRGDRMRPEEQVLMRALRDFNIPKIVTDDMPIFMGLISDLFPSLEIPRMKDLDFEKQVRNAALSLKLQPEDSFILKVVQLVELFAVRHSVFIIGSAGTGKSEVWKTLFKTYQNMKLKPHYNDLEPKAVTNDELFGIINPATREWKDGLFSVLLRDQALMTGDGPKWMVMDGDIDPMWIESLNTVMDDNKVLTLASNERIALTPEMRLLFEISNLKTATPATVSRAGILYINPQDLGWNPYMTSWLENRRDDTEKGTVLILFDKYVPPVLEMLRTKCKQITPIPEITHVQMLCSLLDALLVPSNVPSDSPKEWYETYFVFACVWAFGSACFQDQLIDWRAEFSKWWVNEFKAIKFPPAGSVFNYYIDPETKKFVPWAEKVDKFELDPEIPLQASLVPTAETVRLKFFLNLFIQMRKPVMLVGPGGSGKSIIVNEKLSCLSENFAHLNVPLNFYTTSEMLQKVLEKSLEKKAGRNYGPPGNKFMIYFIDDLNMPEVDQHGTVQPHTLIRQWMNYQHWYDRSKLTLKDIHNIMFLACMNPSAGSFTIDPRLQRHFFVFATNFPCSEELHYIYSSVLNQHLNNHHLKFPVSVIRHGDLIIQLALMMHAKMATTFLPTAIKFHYTFNLRDLTNVFQGIMFANGDCVPTPGMFVRLWMHETCRVYGDKLVDTRDQDNFNKLLVENIKKVFQELPESEYLEKPLIYCHFVEGLGDPKYMPVTNWSHLNKLLTDAMAQYNDLVSAMNLVLFEDAMSHICRINRIMESPRGNVLLVGVGGSGKQSLARLSAFISGLESFQIQLKKGYNISDMKIDLANLYLKTGLKNVGIMLLMTDSQIIDEKFLVLINDMLASGEILDLFSDEEVDHIISAIKPEVKGTGLVDSREMCWKFFIDRVRKLLKIILCFSPVGPSLRIRARRFPAIVNCTSINWFYEWPQEALESVSKRFLSEIEELPGNLVVSASSFMAFVHTSVNKVSVSYFQNEKRFNYTTPKSFLEQILLYRKLLKSSTIKINDGIQRFQTGLQKLLNCALQVDGLQKELAVKEIELMEKNSKAEELIKVVGKEQLKVADEKQFVAEEERKVRIIEEDVSMKQRCCEEDLERAEPALVAAQAALDTLNKNNLTELKSFGSPPPAVANVTAGVMVLFAAKGKLPKDRSWKACKLMMAKLDAFLDALLHYDKENVHPDVVKGIQPYLKDPEFDPDAVRSKSTAAAGLCAWVINIMKFHDVWVVVEPKRRALVAANSELAAARNKLAELKLRISALEAKLQDLTNKFETAVNEKLVCQAQADECSEKIDLANRLVNGLASENVRWRESVTTFQMNAFTLPGDVLLVTAFISYVGCFTRPYREKLLNSHWLPFLKKLKPEIPLTNFVEPLNILADSATIASWNNEGLPNDRMSAENAVIVVNSEKWPLLIDPQLQGIKWIKNKYGERLSVVRLGHDQTMDILEECLRDGRPLLIENIGESLDPILSNLIARNLIHRGRAVRVGEKEMVFNPDFRLILHTKLANPHYKPELQAQTTLINFTVTHKGLEEQLLAEVVKAERPDLEESKSGLTKQQNNFKIALKQLEDELLWRLSSAGGEVLSDKNLVLNLEQSKLMAKDIEVQVVEAKLTSAEIDKAREKYRTAATRASIIYFIMSDLYKINPIYQFSLKAFSVVFHKAILTAEPSADIQERVTNLIDNITFMIFMYTCRGLFESDKLIFLAQMTIQILAVADEIKADELDFVLRFPFVTGLTSPVDFLTNQLWGGIKALAMMDDFRGLDKDIEGAAKRWKKFIEGECPERDKLPQEWKGKSSLQRLCIMRSIRPDRMTYAVQCFIEEKLGAKFVEARSVEFEKSFQEASAIIPIFFILSPGVDPTRDVERVGKRMGFTADGRNFHNVSLGQGQEGIAEEALELSAKVGHWLILQNVHLVKNWLPILDKKMEKSFENPHPDYRLFISAEPSPDPEFHVIPQGILESSIKITNEPPTGMLANLHKALDNFNQNTLEMCSKEGEFKAILFSLCYFHACIAERKKFGPQGWNRSYPFNVGDLTISVHVLYNYLEANSKVPWEDLRYLFGEIMYGGHVTDDWDRRLCRTYLEEFMSPHLMEGDKYFAPGFPAPPNTDYIGYHNYIDDMLPQESPTLYGLHPNAEIGFLTMKAEHLFKTLLELQPRESTTSVTGIISREDKVRQVLDEILDKVPDEFNIPDMISKIEDKTPFTVVAVQECERMNLLMREIRRSLKELSLGLKGELSVTGVMESLETALFLDLVPSEWVKLAYPSMLNLGCWFQDLMIRLKELEAWISDFGLPSTIWLSGFFNPQSFLTAIMQTAARKNEWPLDKMCLLCDVTKKTREDFTAPPREGAYVSGLFMEGARWDMATGTIAESRLKELVPAMPVIYVKAVIEDKHEIPNLYECPIYKTRMRGPTYVWTFNLKTREKPAKWILAGVALLLSA